MNTPDDQWQMVQDCISRESMLTDWERGFVDSLERQMSEGRRLSVKQDETLDEIWERVT